LSSSNIGDAKPVKIALKPRRIILSSLVGLILLVVFFSSYSDLELSIGYIRSADPTLYLVAFISVTLGIIAYSEAWRILLKAIGSSISFTSSLKIVLGSIFLNLAIPTASIGGEVFRIYAANRGYGYPYEAVSATVLLHRVFSMLPFLSGSAIGFIYLSTCFILPSILSQILSIVAIAIAIFSSLALAIIIYPRIIFVAIKPIMKLLGSRGSRFYSRIEAFMSKFEYSMKLLTGARKASISSIILSWLAWILDVLVAYFVFLSLKYSVEIPIVVSVYTIGITIQMIPVGIPGMVGIVETIMATLYSLVGIPSAISVAATLMIRMVMLWFEIAIGSIALLLLRV
jgi:uncharacterized protein (TIRG00374 family)